MPELHVQGWLNTDDNGMLATSKDKDSDSWDRDSPIVRQVESFAEDNGMTGHYKRGLGGDKSYIEDANIRVYFTDKECDIDEAMESLLFELEGEVKTDIALCGYSEYTITGYDVEDFSIGGHDLDYEFSQHVGEYIHFILEC
jgi:hypothetical protein